MVPGGGGRGTWVRNAGRDEYLMSAENTSDTEISVPDVVVVDSLGKLEDGHAELILHKEPYN